LVARNVAEKRRDLARSRRGLVDRARLPGRRIAVTPDAVVRGVWGISVRTLFFVGYWRRRDFSISVAMLEFALPEDIPDVPHQRSNSCPQ